MGKQRRPLSDGKIKQLKMFNKLTVGLSRSLPKKIPKEQHHAFILRLSLGCSVLQRRQHKVCQELTGWAKRGLLTTRSKWQPKGMESQYRLKVFRLKGAGQEPPCTVALSLLETMRTSTHREKSRWKAGAGVKGYKVSCWHRGNVLSSKPSV